MHKKDLKKLNEIELKTDNEKLIDYLKCRRRVLQLKYNQAPFETTFKNNKKEQIAALKARLKEVCRMLRKIQRNGFDEMIKKEKWGYEKDLEFKKSTVLKRFAIGEKHDE